MFWVNLGFAAIEFILKIWRKKPDSCFLEEKLKAGAEAPLTRNELETKLKNGDL